MLLRMLQERAAALMLAAVEKTSAMMSWFPVHQVLHPPLLSAILPAFFQ